MTQPLEINLTSNSIVLPLRALSDEEFSSITVRALENTWPTTVYDNGNYPNRTLSFWPVPATAYAVEFWMWQPLATYETLDDELNMPPGYERYLRLKLAVEIAAEFGKEISASTRANLVEAEAAIKRMNQATPRQFPSTSAAQLQTGASGTYLYQQGTNYSRNW